MIGRFAISPSPGEQRGLRYVDSANPYVQGQAVYYPTNPAFARAQYLVRFKMKPQLPRWWQRYLKECLGS